MSAVHRSEIQSGKQLGTWTLSRASSLYHNQRGSHIEVVTKQKKMTWNLTAANSALPIAPIRRHRQLGCHNSRWIACAFVSYVPEDCSKSRLFTKHGICIWQATKHLRIGPADTPCSMEPSRNATLVYKLDRVGSSGFLTGVTSW